MSTKRGLFFVLAFTLVMSFAVTVHAVIQDVPYESTIYNTAIVSYKGYTFSAYEWTDTDSIDTFVDLIVGGTIAEFVSWEPWEGDTKYLAVSPLTTLVTDTLAFEFANTGNDAEVFDIVINIDSMFLTTQTTDFWVEIDTSGNDGTVTNWIDTVSTSADTGTISTISDSSATLSEDALDSFYLKISKEKGGVGGEGCTVVIAIRVNHDTSVNSGQYTGDNGYTYAEGGLIQYDTFYVVIVAPNIQVTKTDTVTLGGSVSAPIPGATIHYIIAFENIGNDTADDVFIYDHIDTNYLVLADTYAPNATAVWVTGKDNPTLGYGNAGNDWDLATSNWFDTAQWIKFDYDTVGFYAGGSSLKEDTVYFDVYIK